MTVRINWLTKHPVQKKYLWIVVLSMLAPSAVIGFCLYQLVFHLLASQMAFPEAIAANIEPVIERVNFVLLVLMPVVAALIIAAALAVSHRFAGPIERLERDLDRILSGERDRRLQTRKNDDLSGVASRVNALLDQMKGGK
jgi:methyl-accepting chemotaxis protein